MAELTSGPPVAPEAHGLGTSARASILWGGGFTLLRDVAQFGVMLILVRLLSPSDYGTAALVQSIVGVASILSSQTFSLHALQIRNPADIDWQAHFTAAAGLNTLVICLTLAVAWALSLTDKYHETALPLAALAVIFLIEIPGSLRHRMLEAAHDWKRFRILLMIGTLLGLGVGLIVALSGGGVWALIVQPPMLGLPAAIDLFIGARFRPTWSWSWPGYRDTAHFGLFRMGSSALMRGRQMVEQFALAGAFDLATLGLFTRAVGLATLLTGRIGSIAITTLYPVITRAERGTERFRRLSGLVLRGVCWTTAPAAALLAITARDTVYLLYGAKWDAVSPLLPLAAVAIGLGGVTTALSSLLLANENTRTCLMVDIAVHTTAIALALVVIPFGPNTYLAALAAQALGTTVVAGKLLLNMEAIDARGVTWAVLPAVVATVSGLAAVVGANCLAITNEHAALRLVVDGLAFGVIYIATLRIVFPTPLAELLEVAPAGTFLARPLRLALSKT